MIDDDVPVVDRNALAMIIGLHMFFNPTRKQTSSTGMVNAGNDFFVFFISLATR